MRSDPCDDTSCTFNDRLHFTRTSQHRSCPSEAHVEGRFLTDARQLLHLGTYLVEALNALLAGREDRNIGKGGISCVYVGRKPPWHNYCHGITYKIEGQNGVLWTK